ncbi:hypothetical protein J1C67_09585 [Clostridium gasigenes]|uniref:hypothetical protein n=1 Tax=Clostridium gasigenes TaxID=94869 RepID=UPI0014382E05|nr:hypothetical protein [Clostridium gasigenes]NKF08506.1 hypothetical protein [Clostridium gasigenes]QSW21319.1 hypothetical protein J1C67_09585 [Clostridium gasigenes]
MKNIVIVQPSKYLDIRQDKWIKSFIDKGYHVNIIYSVENKIGVTKSLYNEIGKNISFYHIKSFLPSNIPFNFWRNIKIREVIKDINPEKLICRDIMISGFMRSNHKYESYIDVCDNFPEVLEVLMKKPFSKLTNIIANYYERKALKKFKRCIFVSECSAEYIIKKHNLSKVDYYILENVPLKKSGIFITRSKEFDLVYIGTINRKIRDIDIVIEAIEKCSKEGINIIFDIYYFENQIDIINYYRNIVNKMCLNNNIRFFEAVNIEKLPEVLSRYKCGLVPHCRSLATDYTIPNKLYDYLQLGMKVITSDNPSLIRFSDELNVTSYYNADNYITLYEKIKAIVNDENNNDNIEAINLIHNELNWNMCFGKCYKWMED